MDHDCGEIVREHQENVNWDDYRESMFNAWKENEDKKLLDK